tara:strand:- start:190 stop:435 length:246 start_codon:yes stop_codon:yes gene_type:complete
MKGIVKTFGELALSLETEDGWQFYAPYANVDSEVMQYLVQRLHVPVQFNVDQTKYSGKNCMGKRYFATDVKLQDVEISLVL